MTVSKAGCGIAVGTRQITYVYKTVICPSILGNHAAEMLAGGVGQGGSRCVERLGDRGKG